MSDSPNLDYTPPLPQAVRRQAERAEQLAREATEQARGEAGEGAGGGAPADPSITTVVNPEAPEVPPQGSFGFAEAAPPPPAAPPAPQTDWEARYNTLQGKYNTEMAELRGTVRSLQDIIATVQSQRNEPPPPPPAQAYAPAAVTPNDIEAYGQDLIDSIYRWTDARYVHRLNELERRVGAAEGNRQQIQQLQTHTAAVSVEAALDRALPEWRQINVSPEFVAWLNTEDAFSGNRRQDMITRAYESGNAARTLAFFQAFLREHTAVSQPQVILPAQTAPAADRLPLADLAVPGRAPTAAPPTPGAPQKRIWTPADISAFYRQVQRGAYDQRPEEKARIDADIVAAPLEGRFRQS